MLARLLLTPKDNSYHPPLVMLLRERTQPSTSSKCEHFSAVPCGEQTVFGSDELGLVPDGNLQRPGCD